MTAPENAGFLGMSADGSAKTPDNIARLPPKLRERLLKRGIIKEQDLMKGGGSSSASTSTSAPAAPAEPVVTLQDRIAAEKARLAKLLADKPGAPGTPPEPAASAAPGTPPEPAAPTGLGTPPEPAGTGGLGTPPEPAGPGAPGTPPEPVAGTAGALSKASAPPPGSLCKAAAPPPGSLCKAAAPPPGSLCKAAGPPPDQALQEKRRLAFADAMGRQAQLDAQIASATTLSTAAAKKKAAPPVSSKAVASVYSSKPVLKRDAAAAEAAEAEREAKRLAVESPANLRAAAAKAEAAEAPTLTFQIQDGLVKQVGQEAVAAAQAAAAAAPAATPAAAVPEDAPVNPVLAAALTTAAATQVPMEASMAMPPPAGPPPASLGPPLPPGWVRVPSEGDFYFWNTTNNEVSWEHPSGPKKEPEKEVFTEEHKILWSDLGKVIGAKGINLKIIKESIGCDVKVPRGKGGGKGKGGKDKDKGKGKKGKKGPPEGAIIGAGDGSTPIPDEAFVTVTVSADTAHAARGGKRCLEVMLGYGKRVEAALEALGVQAKYPKLLDEAGGGSSDKPRDELDPMDPSSYSDAPQGSWGGGKKAAGGKKAGGGAEPRDSKTANAERF